MMGSATSIRIGAAPAATAPATGDAAAPPSRDFLSLLGMSPAGRKPVAAAGEVVEEEALTLPTDALAQLVPGLFPQPVAAAGHAAGEANADAIDELLAEGGDLLQEVLGETLDAVTARDAVLDQIAAEISAGSGDADPMADVLQQLQPLPGGATGESPAGFRLAAGAELPGLMVQATAGSSATTVAPAATPSALEHALRSTVGSARWSDELGSRLLVMSARGQHEGSLTLAPEHLGPLEVRISLNQNTANVWFGAQHADTRAALAEAMPRLRELFADAGLSLGHAGVSEQAPRRQAMDVTGQAGQGSDAEAASGQSAPVAVRHLSSALLDLYA